MYMGADFNSLKLLGVLLNIILPEYLNRYQFVIWKTEEIVKYQRYSLGRL